MTAAPDIYDELVYVYDGTPEGMLSAVFAAYARREEPAEVMRAADFQPSLLRTPITVLTNAEHASRVSAGLRKRLGRNVQRQVMKVSLSGRPDAGTVLYRFVRFAMDGDGKRHRDITHPQVKPFFDVARSVGNECEKIRQFARFQHLKDDEREVWFARINPKDAVVPLVMGHFVERFNVQPFILYDEVHGIAGVWDGRSWYLVEANDETLTLPGMDATEAVMQDAWRTFYDTLAIDARYNPELRRHFMPKRFWKNLTEMQDVAPALRHRS